MLGKCLDNVRASAPLVHCITNYVTVNDCANILIACGASPIMADDPDEAADITSICSALVVNIGTLNRNTIPSMFSAGKKAAALGHPVLLDPVGAGASALRTDTAAKLLKEVRFTAVRGNISEIKALCSGQGGAKGVDADVADAVTDAALPDAVSFAKRFAKDTGAVIIITGAIDIAADAERAWVLSNGCPMMAKITGSGCMLSAMLGAYLAANPDSPLEASAACLGAMGIAGELAEARRQAADAGNSTFRNLLIDEIYKLDGAALDRMARYEIR